MPAATARRPSGRISPAAARLPDVYLNGTAGADSSPATTTRFTGNCPKWDTWPRLSPSTAKLRESPENSGLSAQHKQPPYGDRSDWSRAGITAGSGCASPATHVGYELIGAGMMILAGGGKGVPLDYPELELWTRVGFDRGMRSRKGER
jgi:hypothetical protein